MKKFSKSGIIMPLMFGIILSTVAFATITLVTPGNGKVDAETLPSTKFITGSRVYVTMNSSNVRQVPAGSLLGTQINGKQGTVNQGPIDALFDNVAVHWWLIDFDSGVDGWVGEDTLEKVSSSVQQTYTVVAGDTLSAIGKKLGIPWQDIAA
ncbi:LysM peptidoglycan-binding domain-containing protein, partial [Candidatus Giovannonibacteria bacterium]|nr:LysM peptidoglycan-binding domain-containing protein [Candidatus Giovannonibacteria bacterium]